MELGVAPAVSPCPRVRGAARFSGAGAVGGSVRPRGCVTRPSLPLCLPTCRSPCPPAGSARWGLPFCSGLRFPGPRGGESNTSVLEDVRHLARCLMFPLCMFLVSVVASALLGRQRAPVLVRSSEEIHEVPGTG